MFRRSSLGARSNSTEPYYKADLTALGFVLKTDEFIRAGSDREFFDFHHTDSQRTNIIRKEAMHACVRDILIERLSRFDIRETHLRDGDIFKEKPEGACVKILTTEKSVLSTRKDILIVVGEHSQDLGVWSWRLLMREHGLADGAAMGFAAMVQAYGLSQRSDLEERLEIKIGPQAPFHGNWTGGGIEEDPAMGIIVLNPGQLLYSHHHHTCMTHTTWQARRRANALADEFEIDEKYNRVTGHSSPERHVRTFFDDILPQLIREDARIYVVGVADGADNMLEYLNKVFATDPDSLVARTLQALALIQPNYSHQAVTADTLRVFLQDPTHTRAWVMSDEPKGKLVRSVADAPSPNIASPGTDDVATPTPWNMPTPTQRDFDTNVPSPPPGPNDLPPEPVNGADDGAFDYNRKPPICATFSSGESEILEDVWPRAMSDVLAFLFNCQQRANEHEAEMTPGQRRPSH